MAKGTREPDSVEVAENLAELDPGLFASLRWAEAHAKTMRLCTRQQDIETELMRRQPRGLCGSENVGQRWRRADCSSYSAAKDEEEEAAENERLLLEELADTPASSLEGVIAKLAVILREAEDNTDILEFPLPHIRSVLSDLRSLVALPESGAAQVGMSLDQPDASIAAWCAFRAWSEGDDSRYRTWTDTYKALGGAHQ